MIRRFRLILLSAALLSGTVLAGARDELVTFTQGLKKLDGQFTQQVFNANGGLKEHSSGRVALSLPNLFRWEYTQPYEQLIVADGKKIWIYEPDLMQATVRPQGNDVQNSPLAALLKPQELDNNFTVTELAMEQGLQWIKLTPKHDGDISGFEMAVLGFSGGQLKRMKVVDAVGQLTDVEFSSWKRNPNFTSGTFRYTPSADVDVVDASN